MKTKRESPTVVSMGDDKQLQLRLNRPLRAELEAAYRRRFGVAWNARGPLHPSLARFAGYALACGLDHLRGRGRDAIAQSRKTGIIRRLQFGNAVVIYADHAG